MDPYLGEIRMFAGNFAPQGWAFCNGSLQSIAQNTALFSLLGTTFGGDGEVTFALPDLRGRLPIHYGTGPGLTPRNLGEVLGAEAVTLTTSQLPAHKHPIASTGAATLSSPDGRRYGNTGAAATYVDTAPNGNFASESNVSAGGSLPHNNLMPFQCLNFIIAVEGIYPSRD